MSERQPDLISWNLIALPYLMDKTSPYIFISNLFASRAPLAPVLLFDLQPSDTLCLYTTIRILQAGSPWELLKPMGNFLE